MQATDTKLSAGNAGECFMAELLGYHLLMSTYSSQSSSENRRGSHSAVRVSTGTRGEEITLTDAELLAGIKAGDVKASRLLVERYQRLMYSIAYGLMGDHSAADDVVQEVFIRFFEKAHRKVRKPQALKTYLARSTTNECIDRLRRAKRRRTLSLEALEVSEIMSDDDTQTPTESMKRKELGELINRALDQLSVRQRKVVILSFTEGLSYSEIAEVLGCEEVTVRTHLHRARQRLQKILGPHLHEFEVGFKNDKKRKPDERETSGKKQIK
ncbi:sigma-70 family RNA polymerase sigma factor [candidate division WOR-3 bacterium]|uniref:Sigma-70 family RNA polymerase sigma factor n=1 Tax=candidate division WOR-3 bacterium TaxID=2052148 RepID=A0A9D5KAH4_UNCW3|nr:sigma-70 family RNA polymerase sigma factor [candidate division WOR-3 bacterium]MBD3365303.1 sigma-70 family RNA polymerase sigma factor [candidate division WOR-3 bacterium]